jgi:hypothetical protein
MNETPGGKERIPVARVERTRLSVAFDLVIDLDLETMNCKSNVNSSGQECPLHTNH